MRRLNYSKGITCIEEKNHNKKSKIGKPSSSLLRAVWRVREGGQGGERWGFHNKLLDGLRE